MTVAIDAKFPDGILLLHNRLTHVLYSPLVYTFYGSFEPVHRSSSNLDIFIKSPLTQYFTVDTNLFASKFSDEVQLKERKTMPIPPASNRQKRLDALFAVRYKFIQ